jgi:hypothetical protein
MWLINIIVIKLKIILRLIIKLKKHLYFQYIKTCLWLLAFFGDKDNFFFYFTMLSPYMY